MGEILNMYVASRPASLGEFIKNTLLEFAVVYEVDKIVKYEG